MQAKDKGDLPHGKPFVVRREFSFHTCRTGLRGNDDKGFSARQAVVWFLFSR